LREARTPLITHAHHITYPQPGRYRDIAAFHAGSGGSLEIARLEIPMPDDLVALAELAASGRRDRFYAVLAPLERRDGDGERIERTLPCVRELERLRWWIDGPPRRNLDLQCPLGHLFNVAGDAGRNTNLLFRVLERNDNGRRRHRHGECRHDRE